MGWPKEVCNVSKKNVKKYTPITACTKEPRELCAPAGCGFKEGSEECFEKVRTQVQDQPQEGQEACCQEVVLCAHRGIWSCLICFVAINQKVLRLRLPLSKRRFLTFL